MDRPHPLALGSLQALPVPGKLELGPDHEIELHLADGHTADGAAYWLPWLRLLVCGDYLSPVEIPMISAGRRPGRYRATLERLAPLVAAADWVVPGHGAPQSGEQAAEILADDLAYLAALAADPAAAALPEAGASALSSASTPRIWPRCAPDERGRARRPAGRCGVRGGPRRPLAALADAEISAPEHLDTRLRAIAAGDAAPTVAVLAAITMLTTRSAATPTCSGSSGSRSCSPATHRTA